VGLGGVVAGADVKGGGSVRVQRVAVAAGWSKSGKKRAMKGPLLERAQGRGESSCDESVSRSVGKEERNAQGGGTRRTLKAW